MKKKKLTLLAVMAVLAVIAVYLAVMQMTERAAPPKVSDFEVLAGRWGRIDGSYILLVQGVMSDGMVNVSYFNPREIRVAESRVSTEDGWVKLFVTLQDEGYPGCTYTLFYYPEEDVLAGVYYQAAVDRTYEVVFVRKEAG